MVSESEYMNLNVTVTFDMSRWLYLAGLPLKRVPSLETKLGFYPPSARRSPEPRAAETRGSLRAGYRQLFSDYHCHAGATLIHSWNGKCYIFSSEISNFSVNVNYIPGNCVSLPLDTVVDFGNDSLYLAWLLRQAAIAQTRGVKSREEIVLSFVLLHCLQSGYHI